MSTLAQDPPRLVRQSDVMASPGDNDGSDPFLTAPASSGHQRFSHFDNQLFALGPATSPEQAKRALEAHLAETERRIQDASKLGTTLVQQRADLAARLKDVEKQQNEGDITPELRQKLQDIEKEYNDVGRETARAFLPKSRVSSNELGGSPFVSDRSVSPVKFESQAIASPSKLSVPNRKQRNQPSNRVHDIEFATEISTSLLAQVRHLQSLLAEKEEALKNVTLERSRLEVEAEGFNQRLRELDESESRYKDENWNLETQIHEHLASAKEAADREKKLAQSLNVVQLEKNAAQRELDDIKLSHAKLSEEHASSLKHHDVELGTTKRSMVMAENERGALQRKVDDLINQNQELAKAVAHQRGRIEDREQVRGLSDEDLETGVDNNTPEHSPPPSPIKGTPRHGMLESETLRSSLHHAHRMIQNLKGNIHREKTEKLELKRMLQDARDELETRRSELGSGIKRSRKVASKEFKKPLKPAQLGAVRNSRSEVIVDDMAWEEDDTQESPNHSLALPSGGEIMSGASRLGAYATDTDHFDTANEYSDAGGFETANEHRATETEDFQTGVEEMSGGDELTETENAGTLRKNRPSALSLRKAGNRTSFQSTASNSDEYTYDDAKTPTPSQPQRLRLKVSRGGHRRPRVASEELFQSSPASFTAGSHNGTPQVAAQSLFAELGDLEGSDEEESIIGTPSRSFRSRSKSATPASRPSTAKTVMQSPVVTTPPVPRASMVDSGMMTEAWEPEPQSQNSISPVVAGVAEAGIAGAAFTETAHALNGHQDPIIPRPQMSDAASEGHERQLATLLGADPSTGERPTSSIYNDMSSQYEPDMTEKLASFPSPPTTGTPAPFGGISALRIQSAPLSFSTIHSKDVEPVSPVAPESPIIPLTISSIQSEHVQPEATMLTPPAPLTMSTIQSEHVRPESLPLAPVVSLVMSTIQSEHVRPVSPPQAPTVPLGMSAIQSEHIRPISPPQAPTVPLGMSAIQSEHVRPVSPPQAPTVPLAMSAIHSEHVRPVSPLQAPTVPLGMSAIQSEHIRPVNPPAAPTIPLGMSTILSEHIEPEIAASDARNSATSRALTAPSIFSSIISVNSEPITPRSSDSLRQNGVMLPESVEEEEQVPQKEPETPKSSILDSLFGGKKDKAPVTPIIAEDGTRQSPSQSPATETLQVQSPLRALSNNVTERAPRKARVETTDESSQTALTAEEIDNMLNSKKTAAFVAEDNLPSPPRGAAVVPPALRVRKSQDSVGSAGRARGKSVDPDVVLDPPVIKRPGSAGSRSASASGFHPPLPNDHQQVIAAAQRTGSSNGGLGSMGPPLIPASAYKSPSLRPRTPSSQMPTSPIKNSTTPRAAYSGGHADIYSSPGTGNRSRATSVSSFTSEIENRFNMRTGMQMPHGLEPGTDPRMINAITQTMIGEYLWKYTRRAGRGGMSENRHRRFFWVHPYTRTLYWSDRDPAQAGRAELKAKSVAIEAVRVVTDDNPMPPGLHRKSLIIVTPGRTIKFTAVTGQRHETWFNALSYLLLRTGEDSVEDTVEVANGLTREDVAEFNPGYGNGTSRRGPPSLSSYNSRTTQNESPVRKSARVSLNDPPSLTPNEARRPSMGTLSRLSTYWKPSDSNKMGSVASRKGHQSASAANSIYEASEAHDSAEDLREMIERQDRESDRLENVRACCDGKHDVGHLHHHMAKGRNSMTPSQRPGATSRNQSRNSTRPAE